MSKKLPLFSVTWKFPEHMSLRATTTNSAQRYCTIDYEKGMASSSLSSFFNSPRQLHSMARFWIFVCLVFALTVFQVVESREMFHDAILSKIFGKILVRDSKGQCKKEAMKHKVSQYATNCGLLSSIVAAVCSATKPAAIAIGGITYTLTTIKTQMDSYIDKECARLGHAASGLEKVKKAMPKVNAVNAFNIRNKYVEVRTPRGLRR
ncbi:hypothetical protein AC1031_021619 [Aphanomyces cochlioides]|nr:hypothetical protein AC1031_021618 [Aphanomyces cochlioides]KAG9408380.1 hypothetical protein AC1031_021619 [Aphanomyces cochlioides]